MLNSKRTKIIVDILMTVFLILSFIRWEVANFAFHAIVGIGCTLFFGMHIFIHRKWIVAMTKSCFAGTLSPALKWKCFVNMLLLVLWSISIVTGFIAIAPFLNNPESVSVWGSLHGVTARIGVVLVVVHIIQHWSQIKAYLGMR